MHGSRGDYIKALREGNYIQFLEWPKFIVHTYETPMNKLEAEDLLKLLAYEWLSLGFLYTDIQQIAVLNKIQEQTESPIFGKYSYALLTLTNVALMCMALHKKFSNIGQLLSDLSCSNVLDHMNKLSLELSSEYLGEQYLELQTIVCDPLDVAKGTKSMYSIMNLRKTTADYIYCLEQKKRDTDTLRLTRLGYLKRLETYLSNTIYVTPDMYQQLQVYVDNLRGLQPKADEIYYLDALAHPPTSQRIVQSLLGIGGFVFKTVLGLEEHCSVKEQPKI